MATVLGAGTLGASVKVYRAKKRERGLCFAPLLDGAGQTSGIMLCGGWAIWRLPPQRLSEHLALGFYAPPIRHASVARHGRHLIPTRAPRQDRGRI
jgi:hypothetical protein